MEKNDVSGPALYEEPEPAFLSGMNAEDEHERSEDSPETPRLLDLPDEPSITNRRRLINVILLGFGFMLNMGSILTAGMAQTVVLNSVFNDATLGYICLAINCATQAIAYLIGPSVCFLMGPKSALVVGSIAIGANIAGLIKPVYWIIFPCAAISGFGVGIVWAVQGYFVTSNSAPNTIERNTGLFWGIFQICLPAGSLFYYFMLRGATTIEDRTRIIVFVTLTVTAMLGTLVFILIKHPWNAKQYKHTQEINQMPVGAKAALVATIRLGFKKEMLLLIPHFCYIGFTLTFWSNINGTALGYTRAFGNLRESLVGLNGVFQGVGEITGGVFLGIFGAWSNRKGRDVFLVLGLMVHLSAFYLIFLNMPPLSPLQMTNELSYIGPNPYVAMLCTALIGFGDAIWNNQLMAYLGSVYPFQTVAAFGVYQFMTAVANVIAFGYSTVLTLPFQLLIMGITGIPALAGYCWLEWKTSSKIGL
ncbi:UNC93-like protein MFSD11 [Paramacrobiotus metropolitanus]|uniref:UNC93-like protein MFSD11 n=1 Tax=Paramacrobiotus metropolitanus TaxID=2943436 RepID=UPI002445B199|nr:UNC93-like protein MFSD11 [Paramacrobiotus metropolitanus]